MGQVLSFCEAQQVRDTVLQDAKRVEDERRFTAALERMPERERGVYLNMAEQYGYTSLIALAEAEPNASSSSHL